MNVLIRGEVPADAAAIYAVHERAFTRPDEARLVNALRTAGGLLVSLVAERDGAVVGHVAFSPVTLEPPCAGVSGVGLAPLAVLPELQRQAYGSQLVRAGLDACRQAGQGFVVVLGHPGYYPRFGFVPGPPRGLRCMYPVPDEVFMFQELTAGALRGHQALVQYHPAFASLD